MSKGVIRSYISGCRWHGLKRALYELAVDTGTQLTITDEDKGWVFHTIYFELRGEEARLRQAAYRITYAIEAHNERPPA